MLLQELPSKRREKAFYKIQAYKSIYWKELPKIYKNLEFARHSAYKFPLCRIVKRTNSGWEIVETLGI
jgi:hypothetical protein